MGDRGNAILRWADFWVGVPLVRCLGAWRAEAVPAAGRPERIGILATAAIGDTLLMSAVLRDLAAAFPEAEIVLFAGESNREIAALTCPVSRIVPLVTSRPGSAVHRIREAGRFDAWIDFGPWPRLNAILSHFARAGLKIGFASIGQHRHHVYHVAVEHRADRHEIENLRQLVAPLGVESRSLPRVKVPATATAAAAATEGEAPIVAHMFPGGYLAHYKRWPRERWIELIDRLADEGFAIVLTGAAADAAEAAAVRDACRHREAIVSRAGELDLAATAALLASARLLVSVNTGIMHLGAACGTPLVALNGPTSPLRWGPLGDRVVNLEATTASAGCLHLGFEYDRDDPQSLATVSVESVLQAAMTIAAPGASPRLMAGGVRADRASRGPRA